MKNLFLRVTMTLALFAVGFSAFAQSTVTGTVKDAAGEAIIGAAVQVAGTHNGAITDLDGSFTLPGVHQGDKLEASCIGYAGQTITWNGGVVNFVLEEDAELLEGTVVTALGIRKDEKKVGYAVSSVSAEKLNATVAPSLGSALYGKAAGVSIKTAPGGATGAISINVRGLSSITGTNQPLVIVDGVPIRNGEANNSDYWGDQRVRSNGLTDINVEDIENLTILKGASATSLYGSEGANGVVLITMKKGKKNSGVHVDFNASLQADVVAYMPKYQTTYGPAYPHEYWEYGGFTEDGFYMRTDKNGNKVRSTASRYMFGPKYDGEPVYFYDGTMRPYSPINTQPWNDLFRTGFTQQYNVAVTAGTEKGNTRFSYTFMDNTPNQYNSHLGKHNFALSGSQDITKNGAVKLGYSIQYMMQNIKNRPYRITRLLSNYSGMFNVFDDIKYIREHTVTSAGFQNQVYTSQKHENPAEGWAYSLPSNSLVTEYLWNILGREQFENNNRLIGSVTPSWQIIPGLTLRGNIATDITMRKVETQEHNEVALSFGNSGYYGVENTFFQTIYGDVLLNYNKTIADKFGIDVNVGYSARNEMMKSTKAETNGGLSVVNWFDLNASVDTPRAGMSTSNFLKQAVYATAGFSYADWLFLEATIRNEKVSTLAPGKNSFWYPSVNGSIILSELFKMPSWVDYTKFRVSYGVVGNAPELYRAAVSYNQAQLNSPYESPKSYTYNILPSNVGNESIRPETTHEWEFGLEGKFFNNRLGFDLSYYHKRIVDQILEATAPTSAGGTSLLMNVGELKNQGVELAAYGTPIENRDWRLDLSGNIAWNRNTVVKLANGLDVLQHANWDGGSALLYSFVGEKMGDIYAFAPKEDENGNKIVSDDGYYLATDEPVKVGNAMPDLTGGFAISLSYKRWTLDANFNFQIGGDVLNLPFQYMMGVGAIEESMWCRDEAHGGLAYYYDANGNTVAARHTDVSGPGGERIWHDGVILDGVTQTGEKNTHISSAEMILEETYGWGPCPSYWPVYYSHGVFDNSYLKCRELALSYTLPNTLTRKFGCNNLRLSVFARNPFYVFKNMPMLDAEATDGTSWISQAKIEGSANTSRTFGFSLRANF